jgi:hypothetical protein
MVSNGDGDRISTADILVVGAIWGLPIRVAFSVRHFEALQAVPARALTNECTHLVGRESAGSTWGSGHRYREPGHVRSPQAGESRRRDAESQSDPE